MDKKKLLTKKELEAKLKELKDRLDAYLVMDVGYPGLSNIADDMREALDNSRMKTAFEKERAAAAKLVRVIDGHNVRLEEHANKDGKVDGWAIILNGVQVSVAYNTDIEGAFTAAAHSIPA